MKFEKHYGITGTCYYIDNTPVSESEYFKKLHNYSAGEIVKSLNDVTPEDLDSSRSKFTEWVESKEELLAATKFPASMKQIGGNHYKKFKIQPAEFCYVNDIPYLEATAIKYLCRWKDKGGIQDLEKAKHFIDLLIEFQNANH